MFDVLWSLLSKQAQLFGSSSVAWRIPVIAAITALIAVEASKDAKAKATLVAFVKESLTGVKGTEEAVKALSSAKSTKKKSSSWKKKAEE